MVRNQGDSVAIDAPVVGLLTIGLAAYWPQMPAALTDTQSLMAQVRAILERGAKVISTGLVDSSEKAAAAGKHFAREQVDLVVLLPGTYATSSLMLPAILSHDAPLTDHQRSVKGIPRLRKRDHRGIYLAFRRGLSVGNGRSAHARKASVRRSERYQRRSRGICGVGRTSTGSRYSAADAPTSNRVHWPDLPWHARLLCRQDQTSIPIRGHL